MGGAAAGLAQAGQASQGGSLQLGQEFPALQPSEGGTEHLGHVDSAQVEEGEHHVLCHPNQPVGHPSAWQCQGKVLLWVSN